MAIFGPKPWTNLFGKMSAFRLCEIFDFYSLESCFFVPEYHETHFTGLYCQKKLENWPSDSCFLTRETLIPNDMYSPEREAHIPGDMWSPTKETHISTDLFVNPRRKHISRVIWVSP